MLKRMQIRVTPRNSPKIRWTSLVSGRARGKVQVEVLDPVTLTGSVWIEFLLRDQLYWQVREAQNDAEG